MAVPPCRHVPRCRPEQYRVAIQGTTRILFNVWGRGRIERLSTLRCHPIRSYPAPYADLQLWSPVPGHRNEGLFYPRPITIPMTRVITRYWGGLDHTLYLPNPRNIPLKEIIMATIIDDGRFGSNAASAQVVFAEDVPAAMAPDKPKRKYTRKPKVDLPKGSAEFPEEDQGHGIIVPEGNGAARLISQVEPWAVKIRLRGVTGMLMHRWNSDSIEEKAAGPRGSIQRKTDDVESYVWRNEDGVICLPGEYVRQSILGASKRISDPTNVKKRAWELFKASIICTSELAPILVDGKACKEWEVLDRRRVKVNQAGITRSRPAFLKGWTAEFTFVNLCPELISYDLLLDRLVSAGRLDGVADFRPTYGRYNVTLFEREDFVDEAAFS